MSRDMTKPTKWVYAQRRLRSAWASAQSDQSSLSAWRNLGSLATYWAPSDNSDHSLPRLIWVFAGRRLILLVFSCRCSNLDFQATYAKANLVMTFGLPVNATMACELKVMDCEKLHICTALKCLNIPKQIQTSPCWCLYNWHNSLATLQTTA